MLFPRSSNALVLPLAAIMVQRWPLAFGWQSQCSLKSFGTSVMYSGSCNSPPSSESSSSESSSSSSSRVFVSKVAIASSVSVRFPSFSSSKSALPSLAGVVVVVVFLTTRLAWSAKSLLAVCCLDSASRRCFSLDGLDDPLPPPPRPPKSRRPPRGGGGGGNILFPTTPCAKLLCLSLLWNLANAFFVC